MKDHRLGWILALALCLGFVSVGARGDGVSRAEFFSQLQREAAEKPVARRPAKPSGVTGEKATCTAQCGGTSVTVNCSGSCTAVDRNCPSQQGYAQCDGGSPVYCPSACPAETCIAWTNCPGGGYVQCEGTTCDSFGHIMCNVMCDGYHYFCPGHFGEELC